MNSTNQIQVWDPLVRIFHWSLAACFMTAYLLGDDRLRLHVLVGSTVLGLIVFRLIWGVIGTQHSRFADFACSPRKVGRHLSDLMRLKPAQHLGHTPAGGVMIFLLLAGLLVLSLSGAMLYGMENTSLFFSGLMAGTRLETSMFIEKVHGLTANILALLVVFHIAGVLVESQLQKQNLTRAMITGYKTDKKEHI